MKTHYLYNPETFVLTEIKSLANNAPAPENSTMVAPPREFAIAAFNVKANVWYNAATAEEQNAYDVANMVFRIVYDSDTRVQQYGRMFYTWDVPENATDVPYNENFACPVLNAAGTAWENAATTEEQAGYDRELLVMKWFGLTAHYNPSLPEGQTSATLNELYPGVPVDFVVNSASSRYIKLPGNVWERRAVSTI